MWDLDVLRANNVSWPVDDSELKDGLIVVKGHTQVEHRLLPPHRPVRLHFNKKHNV